MQKRRIIRRGLLLFEGFVSWSGVTYGRTCGDLKNAAGSPGKCGQNVGGKMLGRGKMVGVRRDVGGEMVGNTRCSGHALRGACE